MQLSIESQPLGKAIDTWAEQTGYQVLIVADTAASARAAPTVHGQYTPEGALKLLLASTDLEYRFINARTVAIRAAEEGDTGASLPQRGSDGARVESGTSIEQVIVTASKRAENIRDVPIAISAITADEIEQRGLVNAQDYLRGVPGANQVDSPYGQSIVIRGIESAPYSQNFGVGTTTATYFGETPTTNTAGLAGGTNIDLKLVDIERVEVLRGPQGTGFGDSSMGGTVRTIPAAPRTDRFAGKFYAGYSASSGTGADNYNGQAVANVPVVTDKLAIRAVGYGYKSSGFYRDRAGSDAVFLKAVAPFGAQAFAINEDGVGSYTVFGGRLAGLYQVTDDLKVTLSYLHQKSETDGLALANSGTYDQSVLQVAPEHVVRGQTSGVADYNIDIANAVMEYEFGWASLLATYSYIDSGSTIASPLVSLPASYPLTYKADSKHREHVGEIRLVTQLQGPWKFLVGLYAQRPKDSVLYDYVWYGNPAAYPTSLGGPLAPGQRTVGTYPNSRDLKQTAAFGEASWELLPRLTLTGGVRGYKYDRTYQLDAVGPLYGAAGTHRQANVDTSGANFRGNLSYKLNDDTLLYAGWAQGFRLGQLQNGLPPGVCDRNNDGIVDGTGLTLESTRRVNSDRVDSYELGSKFALMDQRVTFTANVFRMEWTDIPVTVKLGSAAPGSCGAFPYTANASKALSEGVEFQGRAQIIKPLRIDFGYSWTHARLTEPVPALNAPSGSRLPGSPKVSANLAVQYGFQLGGREGFLRAESTYIGRFFGDLLASPTTESGNYVKLDASARMAFGAMNVDLFVRNLTNRDAFTFRGTSSRGEFYGYRLQPRTIGLQLGYGF